MRLLVPRETGINIGIYVCLFFGLNIPGYKYTFKKTITSTLVERPISHTQQRGLIVPPEIGINICIKRRIKVRLLFLV